MHWLLLLPHKFTASYTKFWIRQLFTLYIIYDDANWTTPKQMQNNYKECILCISICRKVGARQGATLVTMKVGSNFLVAFYSAFSANGWIIHYCTSLLGFLLVFKICFGPRFSSRSDRDPDPSFFPQLVGSGYVESEPWGPHLCLMYTTQADWE